MVAYVKKVRAQEPSVRARESSCVRISYQGFNWKVNKTKFLHPIRKILYYYFAKCYEKVLRGESPNTVSKKKKFEEVRDILKKLHGNYLKPLSEGFHGFTPEQKKEELKRLLDECEEAAADELRLDQHVDAMQVNNPYMNRGVDQGFRYIANDIRLPQVEVALQNGVRNGLDKPEGRPPPSELDQFDLMDFPNVVSEALDDDSNTLLRNRLEEIYAQLEGDITSVDRMMLSPFSKAVMEGCGLSPPSNFGEDVEEQTSTFVQHGEQNLMLPKRGISDALRVLPLTTGVSRTKLADIHPSMSANNNMTGHIQNESLATIPEQKQMWAEYGVHTPFASSSYVERSTYYMSPDCYGSHSHNSTG